MSRYCISSLGYASVSSAREKGDDGAVHSVESLPLWIPGRGTVNCSATEDRGNSHTVTKEWMGGSWEKVLVFILQVKTIRELLLFCGKEEIACMQSICIV